MRRAAGGYNGHSSMSDLQNSELIEDENDQLIGSLSNKVITFSCTHRVAVIYIFLAKTYLGIENERLYLVSKQIEEGGFVVFN